MTHLPAIDVCFDQALHVVAHCAADFQDSPQVVRCRSSHSSALARRASDLIQVSADRTKSATLLLSATSSSFGSGARLRRWARASTER